MPFPVDELIADPVLSGFTAEEIGAYMLLLCAAWRGTPAGTLSSDAKELARLARLTPKRWSAIAPRLMPLFEVHGQRLVHCDLAAEHATRLARYEAFAANGRAGAAARWSDDGRIGSPRPARTRNRNSRANGPANGPASSPANGPANGQSIAVDKTRQQEAVTSDTSGPRTDVPPLVEMARRVAADEEHRRRGLTQPETIGIVIQAATGESQ
jgi:uncharacterized protein YdaU (DUF1376 family)